MKKWFEKLGKKGRIGVIAGAVAAVVVLAVVLICVFANREEAYRNIRVNEVKGVAYVNREGMDGLKLATNMNLQSGDEIVTESGARLTLLLDNDKYIILDENYRMKLYATGTAEDSKRQNLRLTGASRFSSTTVENARSSWKT